MTVFDASEQKKTNVYVNIGLVARTQQKTRLSVASKIL